MTKNDEASYKLFEKRDDTEKCIRDFLAKRLFKKTDLSPAELYEVQAQIFEHIKLWERGHCNGLDTDLVILLQGYGELTSQIYRLRRA
jgi:hypothetical protein